MNLPADGVVRETRRRTLAALGALLVAGCAGSRSRAGDTARAVAGLEAKAGGRLGAFALDVGTGRTLGWRAHERFGMCSTFKLPLAAVILREVDAGRLTLDRFVPYSRADMVSYAPVTEKNLGMGGMTVAALAEAAQVASDNVAANLLLTLIDGPSGFTARLHALGDRTTRLDRFEPEMNFVPTGEERDTTTPEAMARLVARILLGDALSPLSRERLADWTIATKTGLDRLRKGFPADWRAGDKTGTASAEGMPNKHNDVAVAWPPGRGRGPLVVAAYYEAPGRFETMRAEDNAVLAEVGRIAANWVSAPPG